MRAQAKRILHEDEEESAFVSMTDMTVGFLFIMMILLAFFASQIRSPDMVPLEQHQRVVRDRDHWREIAESRAQIIARLEAQLTEATNALDALQIEADRLSRELSEARAANDALVNQVAVLEARLQNLLRQIAEKDREIERLRAEIAALRAVDPLEAYLSRVAQVRREVLIQLRDAIRADFPDLQVELSEESDALRFQGEGLFDTGQSRLTPPRAAIVARLAQRLDEVLPCYTLGTGSRFSTGCNPGFVMIEAVQIEGHTDNRGTDRVNRTLSAARANETFFAMTAAAAGLTGHLNLKGQPVLYVAA